MLLTLLSGSSGSGTVTPVVALDAGAWADPAWVVGGTLAGADSAAIYDTPSLLASPAVTDTGAFTSAAPSILSENLVVDTDLIGGHEGAGSSLGVVVGSTDLGASLESPSLLVLPVGVDSIAYLASLPLAFAELIVADTDIAGFAECTGLVSVALTSIDSAISLPSLVSVIVVSSNTPPDLLAALVEYLEGSSVLGSAMGGVRVYTSVPIDTPTLPYLLVEGYEETLPGPTADDEPIELVITIFASTEDGAKNLAPILHTVVDSPAINPNSLRLDRLTWMAGQEMSVWRNSTSKVRRVKGFGTTSNYVWRVETAYQFWVDEIQ